MVCSWSAACVRWDGGARRVAAAVEFHAVLRLAVQSLEAWLGRGGVNLLVPGTEAFPRRLDLVIRQVGHDGVASLEGTVVAVALE